MEKDQTPLTETPPLTENQILLIDKPKNMTSFGVVARIRRKMSEKFGKKVKVGHTGTLDPFATGLLILMTGKNTKKCQEFLKLDKVYQATLKLGETSTTGDPEGEKIEQKFYTIPTTTEVEAAVKSYEGEIEQTPPAFSAIKINGERAYNLARKGASPEMPTRKVKIYDLRIDEYSFPVLKLTCHVSSGTYIRSLAEDLGKTLKTGAYLTDLRRLKIGSCDVKNAKALEEFGIKS